MIQYMVEPFCGLSLWFVAYDEKNLTEMKEKTVENSMSFSRPNLICTPDFQKSEILRLDQLICDIYCACIIDFVSDFIAC